MPGWNTEVTGSLTKGAQNILGKYLSKNTIHGYKWANKR